MLHFLGIGAQKAGTTWLYQMLKQHPEIEFPCGKETHYWNRQYPQKTIANYLHPFNESSKCTGEITPAYGHLELEIIANIYKHLPNLKLIYIIRDPIERAWSAALMALKRAELEYDEASEQWFIDHFLSKGSLERGDYQQAIDNWTSIFPEKNLLILDYCKIQEQPEKLLNTCCKHLSINQLNKEQLSQLNLKEVIFKGSRYPLPPTLRKHLESIYTGRKLWPINKSKLF